MGVGLARRVGRRLPGGTELVVAADRRRYVRHVRRALANPEMFAGGPLPRGYGRGLTERAVEYGWMGRQGLRGSVLDAGSALNHPFVLDAVVSRCDALTIFTLAPEPESYPERGVEYVYGDLRRLPFPDGSFDVVVSLSTLEHVGMDNSLYGSGAAAADRGDPVGGTLQALGELVRVARPGGKILITAPFGVPERYGWVRQLDAPELRSLVRAADPAVHELVVYRDLATGWQRVEPADAADSVYRTYQAEAVACLSLTLP